MEELIQFIKHPTYFDKNSKLNFRYFVKLLAIYFLAAIILSILTNSVSDVFNIKHFNLTVTLKVVIVVVILGPIYEEIIFRTHLYTFFVKYH